MEMEEKKEESKSKMIPESTPVPVGGGGGGGGGGGASKVWVNEEEEFKPNNRREMLPDRSSRGCYKGTCRRMSLLIWKNCVLRKRHYCLTCCEVCCSPCITLTFVLFIVILRGLSNVVGGAVGGGAQIPFPSFAQDEYSLLEQFAREVDGKTVGYTPKNTLTNDIITQIDAELAVKAPVSVVWKDFRNEKDMVAAAKKKRSQVQVGIVFQGGFIEANGQLAPVGGTTVSYKLRPHGGSVDDDSLITTPFLSDSPPTLGLQFLLDKIIIERLVFPVTMTQSVSVQKMVFSDSNYAAGVSAFFLNFYKAIPYIICQGFITIIPAVMLELVQEKESGIKELMRMMGLPNWMHWVGWMIDSMSVNTIAVTLITLILFLSELYKLSSGFLFWVMIMLFATQTTTILYLISSFFQTPFVAITFGMLFWHASSSFSNVIYIRAAEWPFIGKMFLVLLPSMAFTYACHCFTIFEVLYKVGVSWKNVFEPPVGENIAVGHIMIMMLLSSALYFFLAIYVENIMPSEFGIRKPFYYIFQGEWVHLATHTYDFLVNEIYLRNGYADGFKPSTWCNPKVAPRPLSEKNSGDNSNLINVEEDPKNLAVGVEIRHLSKVYPGSKKAAVDDLTLNMFQGQITALLGHNGAGKTTTMSILTGMCAPTNGTAILNGYDINKSIESVRQNVGLCPQNNMLFSRLTVEEHLQFFGKLSALSSMEVDTEMEYVLGKLDLQDKIYFLAKDLSGGQKRKLQLGISVIGGSKIVVLDEPTSGLDPEARRNIWNFLLDAKEGKTIILTTHYMAEADVLSDRIAIMSEGKLECCGSSMFLKVFYGAGYILSLTMETEPTGKPDEVLKIAQKHVDGASFKSQYSQKSKDELIINLPTLVGVNINTKFAEMFGELAEHKAGLGIKTMGVSFTTMDDVFVKVDELRYGEHGLKARKESQDKSEKTNKTLEKKREGISLSLAQFHGLLAKKVTYALRNWVVILFQFLMVLIPVFYAYALTPGDVLGAKPVSKLVSLSSFKNPVTLYTWSDPGLKDAFKGLVGRGGKEVRTWSLEKFIKNLDPKQASKYIVGAELPTQSSYGQLATVNGWYNPSRLFPTAPFLALNLVTNTILRTMTPSTKYLIQLTHENLLSSARPKKHKLGTESLEESVSIITSLFPIGLYLIVASFVIHPDQERLTGVKHLQFMTGVSSFSYWLSFFLWDYLIYLAASGLAVLSFMLFTLEGFSASFAPFGVLALLLAAFGFVGTWMSYLFSLYLRPASAFCAVILSHVLSAIVAPIMIVIVGSSGTTMTAHSHRFLSLFPAFPLVESIKYLVDAAFSNELCAEAPYLLTVACKPKNYLVWTRVEKANINIRNDVDKVHPGIGQNLVMMIIMGFVSMLTLFVIDSGLISRLFTKSENTGMVKGTKEDRDVTEERTRVQELMKNDNIYDDALTAWNLRKHFKSTIAVSNVTFGVRHGECFGLLGVNGAGKTTAFRILTGDESISSGNAFMSHNRTSLNKNPSKFLSNIGYCPQFDGIITLLTGKELLLLFARLRGIPPDKIESNINKWIALAELEKSANMECGKYSGGMKRRLCTAMSLIGDPPVILMDEPTSGVDPVARRQFWRIMAAVTQTGQSIILTSHSMEECEAACTRLTIMVRGKMQCIGGVSYLKHKFAQGYFLNIKLKIVILPDQPEPPRLLELMETLGDVFFPCILKDTQQSSIHYHLLNTRMSLATLFKATEELKENFKDIIDDYSVNEATLEDVFLSFAR